MKSLNIVTYCGIASIGIASVSLSGCMSSNVKSFQPDVEQSYVLKTSLKNKVRVGKFVMPAGQDKSSILCRLAGNINLPGKMKYSQYLRKSFIETLISSNRFTDSAKAHTLKARIFSVDFSSTEGNWVITAGMRVDRNPVVNIRSVTTFGTSFDAFSACKNVANSFQDAAADLVKNTFNNPIIKREINS